MDKIIDGLYDAEILVVEGDKNQEVLATIPFALGYSASMYADPFDEQRESVIVKEFMKGVVKAARTLSDCYQTYPDSPIHIQVKFNFTNVNA